MDWKPEGASLMLGHFMEIQCGETSKDKQRGSGLSGVGVLSQLSGVQEIQSVTFTASC